MYAISSVRALTKEEVMKTRYLILHDVDEKPRVIVAMTRGERNQPFYGMAIRSDDDENDLDFGKKMAYRRMVRAIKKRRTCFVVLPEAVRNLWNLKFEDFRRLMLFTNGRVEGFPKMGISWPANYDKFTELLEAENG